MQVQVVSMEITKLFHLSDKVSSPLQYYAATKISNEVMAESYSRLYKLKSTGLRFFIYMA